MRNRISHEIPEEQIASKNMILIYLSTNKSKKKSSNGYATMIYLEVDQIIWFSADTLVLASTF